MISWPVIFIQIAFFLCSLAIGAGISLTFHQALSTPYPWMQMTMLVTGGITFCLIGFILALLACFALVHGIFACCNASGEGIKFYFRQVDPSINEAAAKVQAKIAAL
jgi:hypothetical protein